MLRLAAAGAAAGFFSWPLRAPAFIRSDPRVKPLWGSVDIDWQHPLANRLAYAWTMNDRGGIPLDLVSQSTVGGSNTSGTSWVPGIGGVGMTFAGTSDGVGLYSLPHGNGNITVIGRGVLVDTASQHSFLRICGPAGVGGVNVYRFRFTNANNISWELFNVVNLDGSIAGVGTAGHYYSAACAYTLATKARFYVQDFTSNTLFATTVTDSNSPFSGNAGSPVLANAGNSTSWQSFLESIVIYSRALSDNEMAWYHAEPYSFLRPKVVRRYFTPSTPAATTTVPERAKMGVGS